MKVKNDSAKASKQSVWLSIIIGFSIFVLLVLDKVFHVPLKYVLPPMIIGFWIWGSVMMWQHANTKARKNAWWRDDSCSGWRGY